MEGRDKLKAWDEHTHNKDLYSTGNSIQYSVIIYMRKESRKECIYIYIYI